MARPEVSRFLAREQSHSRAGQRDSEVSIEKLNLIFKTKPKDPFDKRRWEGRVRRREGQGRQP